MFQYIYLNNYTEFTTRNATHFHKEKKTIERKIGELKVCKLTIKTLIELGETLQKRKAERLISSINIGISNCTDQIKLENLQKVQCCS